MRTPMPGTPARPPLRQGHEEHPRPLAAAAGLKLGPEHLDAIDESHRRCVAMGVSRIARPDFSTLGMADLTIARERNMRLHDHAAPVMEMLHEQIVNSTSMVVLTDATGTILHSIGDDDFLERASKVALAPGANWSESAKGTNAVGTALMAETPTLVHADEHYLHANHFLTCSAAPILDPRGNILGVLDVSGDHRSYHQHTMALVKMSARMIENRWLTDDYRNVMRLHFHSRMEFIGTLMEGILAIGADGRIVGANRGALEQLGLSGAGLRMHTLASLFGSTVGALVDRFRSPLATPLAVHQGPGRQFHLLARFNWPVWMSVAEAVAGTAPVPEREISSVPLPNRQSGAVPATPATQVSSAPLVTPLQGLAALRTGDAQMDAVVDKLALALDRDIPLLIQGETGTGKATLARAIHADSKRAARPFVVLNCAAIPAANLEAALFGYEEGVFSGPRQHAAPGLVVQASGGTLYLDEIGDIPLPVQAQLLRALQDGRITPLGAARAVAVDLAIISGTRHHPGELIERKQLREDLFYRLAGLSARLPALRERTDLHVLAAGMLSQLAVGPRMTFAEDALALLAQHPWPGNVRELFNVLRSACVLAGQHRVIEPKHLPEDIAAGTRTLARAPSAVLPAAPTGAPTRAMAEVELAAIHQALEAAGGNISQASKQLGISRNTIYRKLRWKQSAAATAPSPALNSK